jgi:hypothetical protein
LNNIKIENENTLTPVIVENVVLTLIFSITKHFIGDPQQFLKKSSKILSNLTFPKLQDFRWYKDPFLSKVFTKKDCQHLFWKEIFLSRLPELFAEKVRLRIKNLHYRSIPYEILSY